MKIREKLMESNSGTMAGHYATKKWLPLIVLASSVFYGCESGAEQDVKTEALASVACATKDNLSKSMEGNPELKWSQLYAACEAEIKAYQQSDPVGYSWFSNAANGFSGTPLVILKSLPAIAPEIWGKPEDNFSKFGLFADPTNPNRVLPRGLGIASTEGRPLDDNKKPTGEIDYAKPSLYITTFSCGACHSARVNVNGDYHIIEGAPNTKFDVRSWRQAFIDTRKSYLTPDKIGTQEAPGSTTKAILAFIDAQPPGYFAKGLPLLPEKDEAAIDAQQRAYVKAGIITILNTVAAGVKGSDWMVKLQLREGGNYGYAGHSPALAGNSSGQSDGSGDLLAQLIASTASQNPDLTEEAFLASPQPAIPPFATVTDAPSVWNQQARAAAQWDGSVSMGFWRNIAAQLPIVGIPSKVDLNNTHIVDKFLTHLPAAPYPFNVDLKKAVKGEALFKENCADCHSPKNSRPYWEMYTDFNRAKVLNEDARNLFLAAFTASCHDKEFSYTDAQGQTIKPCTMDGEKIIRDTTVAEKQGYMASVLDGIWARAPYLHNGSVPTLRHLLVPHERPATFLRGTDGYDQDAVGWLWNVKDKKKIAKSDTPTLMTYNTASDGLSNMGHDKDIRINGKSYRLDWSGKDSEDDLLSLLEYMKTL